MDLEMTCRQILAVVAFVVCAQGCTTYDTVPVNIRTLASEGRHGIPMSTAEASSRELGRVSATTRTWLFGSCEEAMEEALSTIAEATRARGGERLSRLRFRAKFNWTRDPVCRRNFTYAVLVLPLFLPFPTSVTVSGVPEY